MYTENQFQYTLKALNYLRKYYRILQNPIVGIQKNWNIGTLHTRVGKSSRGWHRTIITPEQIDVAGTSQISLSSMVQGDRKPNIRLWYLWTWSRQVQTHSSTIETGRIFLFWLRVPAEKEILCMGDGIGLKNSHSLLVSCTGWDDRAM